MTSSNKSSKPSHPRLPTLSNKQLAQVYTLTKDMNLSTRTCPTCRQKIVEEAPGIEVWHPSTYKLYGQEFDCDCKWQLHLREHYILAGIPKDYWTLSADDFFGDPHALAEVQSYLDQWTDMRWHGMGLHLYSPNQGTGKTMLATLIAKNLILRGEHVVFITLKDAIRALNTDLDPKQEQFALLRHTPVLILDELIEPYTTAQQNYFAGELEYLIRFRTGGNGVTITTTNLTPDQLEEFYPRTFSLLEAKQTTIKVNGEDARKSGDIQLLEKEMIKHGWARPIC